MFFPRNRDIVYERSLIPLRKGEFAVSYGSIGALAILVLVIINRNTLLGKRHHFRNYFAQRAYRKFLLSVLIYYVADMMWGVLDSVRLTGAMDVETSVYFATMGVSILMWTQYVVAYLEDRSAYEKVLIYVGRGFLAFQILAIAYNFFSPALFWFDENGVYHAGVLRYVNLIAQIIMFLMTSVHALRAQRRERPEESRRQRTIGAFGIAMAAMLGVQLAFPLLPLYTVGYMIGTCLLYSFVIEDEEENYRFVLEEALEREKQQRQELDSARQLAYTDALTGVKSKLAYVEATERMDQRIRDGEIGDFAVAVFDLDGLKHINDTLGHDIGDKYIKEACRIICRAFQHSPVFRIGGDEFAVILENEDFSHREKILAAFTHQMRENAEKGEVVISVGMSEFIPVRDACVQPVFERADSEMYFQKHELERFKVPR